VDIEAPYDPGSPDPVQFAADDDPGGRDIVSGTTGGAEAAAAARLAELESDTYGQGSAIGDVLTLPSSPFNPAVGVQDNPPFEGPYFPETNPA
jgi:hypothetical protein